ncbi:MAG TPA: hypothetical protein VGF01_16995 [Terracidiphilus sp.]
MKADENGAIQMNPIACAYRQIWNTVSKRGKMFYVFVLCIATVIFLPMIAPAQPCEGRPIEVDLGILTDRAKEVIVERHYWDNYGSIPEAPTKLIVGISSSPVETFEGANVVAILPETGDVLFWKVCGDEFAFIESEMTDAEQLKGDRYASFFNVKSGAHTFETIVHFESSPDFGPLDKWKEEMLLKIQSNIACFLAQNDAKASGRKSISLYIGEFNRKSAGVMIAIPELNELWTIALQLNSTGVPDDVGFSHEQKLSGAKKILRSRLFRHSFVRKVDLKCPAAGAH